MGIISTLILLLKQVMTETMKGTKVLTLSAHLNFFSRTGFRFFKQKNRHLPLIDARSDSYNSVVLEIT